MSFIQLLFTGPDSNGPFILLQICLFFAFQALHIQSTSTSKLTSKLTPFRWSMDIFSFQMGWNGDLVQRKLELHDYCFDILILLLKRIKT